MNSRILTSAVFAGAGAGLITALLQLVFVQPLLLQAELFESGQMVHFGAANAVALPEVGGFDPTRDGLSILFTMLNYTGFALLLVAAMAMAERNGHAINARIGILWGLAGFVAVQVAPTFSLPPEVPGLAAAEVAPRQIWWAGTVISAAVAMWLIGFGKSWIAWGGAAVLLLAPHLIGAPEPEFLTGPVPPEISAAFAARAIGTGLAAWVLMGTFAGWLLNRESPVGQTVAAM
jgi:cobalt transporter subunit CbtA